MNFLKLKLVSAGFILIATQVVFGQEQPVALPSQILVTTTPGSGSAMVQVILPTDVQTGTLSAKLNGNDVSSLFSPVNCGQGICEQATVTAQNGLNDNKNALSVIAKRKDGSLVSARDRFAGISTAPVARAMAAGVGVARASVNALPTLSSFLPPAIAFNTVEVGGYTVGKPWIQIGTQTTYPANTSTYTCQSPNLYTVIILDRLTLTEKTSSPEASPQCIDNGADLKTYLATKVDSSDLVIVGSNQGVNSDAGKIGHQLDTSDIGGSAYNCIKAGDCSGLPSTTVQSQDIPLGYLAIGVGGAASGTAYENYFVANNPWVTLVPNAHGMLVEDANGNYNFQTSRTSEYTIVPNDANNSEVSTITVGTVPGDSYYEKGIYAKTYRPPVSPGQNGMWLLKLQRSTLYSIPFDQPPPPPSPPSMDACPSAGSSTDGKIDYFDNCGQFYDTGDTNATKAAAAYVSLAADLLSADSNELVFLVSIGNQPGYPDTNGHKLIPSQLGFNFSQLGGAPETLKGLSAPGSTYSFVGCMGCGNSLGGHAVISTNLQPQQGQNGYIHGLLQPNLNGLFWPTQASLDQPGSDGKVTTDFTMQEVGSTQPVEWPELSTTVRLASGTYKADTTDGQNAAYYYISYQLITQYYIQGAQGNYIDDIHYYFTGGNNTFLDYHIYDPASLAFPGATPASCYQWTDPVAGRGTLACFTQNDFNAVRAQMHNEIVYLTNVLQFMVTGSTNLKDVVASGNGSAALALINAAASVKASTLQPPPATPVKSNVSNILNLVGNVVSVAAAVATGGLSTSVVDAAKTAVTIIGPSAGVITGAFGIASSATGGLQTGGGAAPLPSKDYTFLTTIGDLSSTELQQTFTAGFDVGLDTILGDWYKLSTIGPKITDTSQAGFQAPTQASQLVGTLQIGQASQRSFYMALLPISYSVQHYTYWWGQFNATNYPDMGARTDDTAAYCNTWYFSEPAPSTINLVSKSYFSYSDEGPTKFAFWYGDSTNVANPAPIDWYILASSATPSNAGSGSQRIQLLDPQVASTLFNASQLNIPMDPLLDQRGPLASVWWDSASVGFDHFSAGQTCSYYVAQKYGSVNGGGHLGANAVVVTLNVPATGVLGDNVTLKATALSGGNAVTSGTILFSDGSTTLGQAALDSTGTASLTINTLALGTHTIGASFLATSQYTASSQVTTSLIIYANDPMLVISPSAASLTVTSGSTSSPLSLQVSSKWGLAGSVTFACSGLPAGTTCSFAPAQVTLTDGSSAATSLTIRSVKQTSKLDSSTGVIAAILLPLQLLWLRRRRTSIPMLFGTMLVTVASLGVLTGCSGGSSPRTQTTTSSILVTASSGNVTRSIPISLTVQ